MLHLLRAGWSWMGGWFEGGGGGGVFFREFCDTTYPSSVHSTIIYSYIHYYVAYLKYFLL